MPRLGNSRPSSQVLLMASHISAVIWPRTAWAFSRAWRRQLSTEAGLLRSRAMKLNRRSASSGCWLAVKASSVPVTASGAASSVMAPRDCGSSEREWVTSSMRTRFSARST